MPFREKKAWVTIVALLIVFVPYYIAMVNIFHGPDPDFFRLGHLALMALVVFILLEVSLILAARKLSPEDAGTPLDEREQLFAFRAARISYITLIGLIILVTFFNIHSYGGNWGWGMMYLAAILVSEITRAATMIVQYRRG